MNITKYFEPQRGVAVISPVGTQMYPERLNSYSQILSQLFNSQNNNKHAIDSCWESGDIYYANYDYGCVNKIHFNGTITNSLSTLKHPVCVSVIQHSLSMDIDIVGTPSEDRGCWIADVGTGNIIKTDADLNVLYTYSGVSNPVCIASDVDTGCLVVDDGSKRILKLSSSGQLLDSIDYSELSPPISSNCEGLKEIRPFKVHHIDVPFSSSSFSSSSGSSSEDTIQSVSNSSSSTEESKIISRFWFLCGEKVYQLYYREGVIKQVGAPIDPLIGLPSNYSIAAIDVDLNDQNFHLYVGAGNDVESTLLKYHWNKTEVLNKTITNIPFPYILKVVQGYGSVCLYVLPDISHWSPCNMSTSSSSSSYSSSSSISYYVSIFESFRAIRTEIFG